MNATANDNASGEDEVAGEIWDLAERHEQAGDFAKAQLGYSTLAQWQLDRGEPLATRLARRVAAVSAMLGDFEPAVLMLVSAREAFRARANEEYGFFRLTLQLVQVCLKAGDVRSAAQFLAEATSPLPAPGGDDDTGARACLQDFRTKSWAGKSRNVTAMGRVDACVTLARFCAAMGRFQVAIQAAEAALEAVPGAEQYFSSSGIGDFLVQLHLEYGNAQGAEVAARSLEQPRRDRASDRDFAVRELLAARRETMQGRLSSAKRRLLGMIKTDQPPISHLELQATWALACLLTRLNRISEASGVLEAAHPRLLDHPMHRRWRRDLVALHELILRKRAGADHDTSIPLVPEQAFESEPPFSESLPEEPADAPGPAHSDAPKTRELFSDTWTFLANRVWQALTDERPELAASHLGELESLAEQTDSPRIRTRTRYYRALYDFYHASPEVARGQALQCLDDARRQEAPLDTWEYLDLLARIAARRGKEEECQHHAAAARKQLDGLLADLDDEDRIYFVLNKWSHQDSYLTARMASLKTIQENPKLPPPLAGWAHRWKLQTERLIRYRELNCLVGWDIQRRLESTLPAHGGTPSLDPTPDEATSSMQVESWVRTQLVLEQASAREGARKASIIEKSWPLFRVPRRVALIHYYVVPDQLFVFVLTRGSITVHMLGISKIELYEAVQEALQAIMKQYRIGGGQARVMKALERVSNDMGIQNILQSLADSVDHVVIIPHHMLVHVPYAALPCGQDTLLCEKFTLSCLPNLRWFEPARAKAARPTRPSRFLGVAVPQYPGTDLAPLPHAVEEVQCVQRLVPAPATMLEGADAQPQSVLDALEKGGWAHVACHGVLDKEQPHQSRIVVAGPNRTTGAVTLADIQRRQLDGLNLVVLASCWLSGAIVLPGQELVCLPAAFLRAGAKGVIAPLWEVDDEANVEFMKDFYQAAAQWSTPRALAEVQRRWLRRDDRRRASPFYWAGYLHHGHG